MEVAAVRVGLLAHRGAADAAGVVVLVPAREDEQQLFADRVCPLAARAEEARRLELAEAVCHAPYSSLSMRATLHGVISIFGRREG